MELETEVDLKSRMRENCTYGSVRGSRQAFLKLNKRRKECRDCLLDEPNMTGVEIDFVVTESLKALKLYENIFDLIPIEVTNLPKGENEVIFSIYGVRFHMLDENREFQLLAPDPEHPNTIWFNIMVPDIHVTYRKAMESGCIEVQPVIELADFGVSNAMFTDPFGYLWMLHQVHREVSFEDRMKLWEEEKNKIQ